MVCGWGVVGVVEFFEKSRSRSANFSVYEGKRIHHVQRALVAAAVARIVVIVKGAVGSSVLRVWVGDLFLADDAGVCGWMGLAGVGI